MLRTRRGRWLVGLAVAAALAGCAALMLLPSSPIERDVLLSSDGHTLIVAGVIACARTDLETGTLLPDTADLSVTITQETGREQATGNVHLLCYNAAQRWKALVSVAGEPFHSGPAQACASAGSLGKWCRRVHVVRDGEAP